jgi:hypothetical protein
MKKLGFLVVLVTLAFTGRSHAADQMTLPPNFVYEDIYRGHGMTAIDFDPTGAIFVCEKMGRVLLFEQKGKDFNDPVVLLDLKGLVNFENESGLLGIAVDPQFNLNHFVYVFYTTNTDQQLARYTLDPTRHSLTDPLVLLSGLPKTHSNHKAGDIHFSPKDPNSIYITVGNDADPNGALIDNPDTWNGKVLRVNKANGQGLPANPFYNNDPTKVHNNDPTSIRSRVWAMGLRNPFRFTFTPSGLPLNHIYISENGDGLDRFYQIGRGANGGWNHGGDNGWWKNPPPDQDVHILGTHRPSMTGIAIAETGPFASPEGPVLYESHWFGPDILRGVLSGPGWTKFTPFPSDPGGKFAVHLKCVNLKFGPDGALYITDTYFADSPGNDFRLGRIKYTGPALPAMAAPVPPPAAGDTASAETAAPAGAPLLSAPVVSPPGAPNSPAAAVAGFSPGGSAVLKKEVVINLSYGDVRIPAGSEIKLISKAGNQWTAQWQSSSLTVDESDLQQK